MQAVRDLSQAFALAVLHEEALRLRDEVAFFQAVQSVLAKRTASEAQNVRGEALGLFEEELAFYDALETNDSAVKVLGDDTLRGIARELVETVRRNVTIDWTLREDVRTRLRAMVKRIPDGPAGFSTPCSPRASARGGCWSASSCWKPSCIRSCAARRAARGAARVFPSARKGRLRGGHRDRTRRPAGGSPRAWSFTTARPA